MIISKGHLVASDTPDNLTALFAGTTTIQLEALGTQDAVRGVLDTVEGIEISALSDENGLTRCELKQLCDEDIRADLFYAFANAKLPIVEMNRVRASLEDVFLELTSGDAPAPSEPQQEVNEE